MQPIDDSVRLFLVSTLIGASPLIAVCLSGIIIAVSRWSRHPGLSLLTSVGLGLLLMSRIVLGAVTAWLPRYLIQNGWAIEQVSLVSGVIVFLVNLVNAIALSLLVWAVFAGREKKKVPEF